MTWIDTVPYSKAQGLLKTLYNRIKGPNDNVDNIMQAHSLRPHTMEAHLALYKAVLHNNGNTLPPWFLEVLGLHVSLLNRCDYCVEHHYQGLRRRLQDDARAERIREALEARYPARALDGRESAAVTYAEKLTRDPAGLRAEDISLLKEAGFDDGHILEINQVVSYFAYANRTVLGLGITKLGDVLGLSPSSDNPGDWSHR
jgi:uncharacterized peroxidase-related enzyme